MKRTMRNLKREKEAAEVRANAATAAAAAREAQARTAKGQEQKAREQLRDAKQVAAAAEQAAWEARAQLIIEEQAARELQSKPRTMLNGWRPSPSDELRELKTKRNSSGKGLMSSYLLRRDVPSTSGLLFPPMPYAKRRSGNAIIYARSSPLIAGAYTI